MRPRPRKGFTFVRQSDGRIVYKYIDVETGHWRAKRVPPHIVSMPEAQAWIVDYMGYGVEMTGKTKLDLLQKLAEGATTEGERQAALNAIEKIKAKANTEFA
jgi:hypothetical protein